ncbi:MAG: transcriptional repressor [Bdellovibrionales bacterium]|nr:transcriptional repressor [Bdellovibrionales bacterium]
MNQLLEKRGLRATPHRVRIAQKVLQEHCHFTAEDICGWAGGLKKRLSRATVYNILNEFVAVGLLKSFYSSALGKTIYDSNTENHFHLYDTDKDQILDVDPSLVTVNTSGLKGYRIDQIEILMKGRRR